MKESRSLTVQLATMAKKRIIEICLSCSFHLCMLYVLESPSRLELS